MLRVNHLSGFGVGGYDPNAQGFITAAGITDATQKAAINRLVKDLKAYGLWAKCRAIYPLVGGTATTHKFNLKDPRDLDAAFRVVFAGTITHDSNGITGNGTTGCGDTKFNGSAQALNDNTHLSVYIRTDTNTTTATEIGAYNGLASNWVIKGQNDASNASIRSYTTSGTGRMDVASTDPRGFWMESRRAAADGEAYKNGSSIATTGDGSENIPNANVFLLSRDAISQFSNHNVCFASIGTGLTDTEAANFYTCVQAFQVALSRSV